MLSLTIAAVTASLAATTAAWYPGRQRASNLRMSDTSGRVLTAAADGRRAASLVLLRSVALAASFRGCCRSKYCWDVTVNVDIP
ncbi:hypothetical protein V8C86DRAFT_2479608, partial [Haematococcus lacustris]